VGQQSGDAGTELATQVYRGLLEAEQQRREVFHGEALPKFLVPPPPHVEQFVLMLKKMRTAPEQAEALVEQAEEASPALAGEAGGVRFSNIRDADDRVSAVLEVYHGAEYLWVPLDQVVRLEITPPTKLRELMWAQARLQMIGQPSAGDVFLPMLYVDSYKHESETIRLGRVTEWESWRDVAVFGSGRRMLLVDGEERSLLDLGSLVFDDRAQAAGAR